MISSSQANGSLEVTNMARRRYQRPTPRKVGRRWEMRLRVDVADSNGNLSRQQIRVNLGTVDEIKTAKQALRIAEPILARINTCRPRYVVSFAEIAARYEQTMLTEMKPSSQTATRSVIKKWLLPAFGKLQVHDITAEAVQAFVSRIRQQVSDKTVWNVVTTLRAMWRTCMDWGYTSERIFDHVQLRRPQETDARFFTVDEVRRILAASEEPYHSFYLLAAETGMRAGELCALSFSDIDFLTNTVTARRSVWHGNFTDTKTRRQRRFAISPGLAAKIQSLRRDGFDLVFHTRNGTPWISDDLVKRHLQPLLAKLGIPPGGMHAFRHFNGSIMLSLGAPAQTARDRLGHSSLTVTSRYSHGVTEDDRAIADQLGRKLSVQEGTVQ